MASEKTILGLQFFASLLMATDYFLSPERRENVNKIIQNYVSPVHDRVQADLRTLQKNLLGEMWEILLLIAYSLFTWLGLMLINSMVSVHSQWAAPAFMGVMTVLTLLFLIGFAYVLPQWLNLFYLAAVPISLGLPLLLICKFLLNCPKGTIFGVGFIFLMVAFGLRYMNLG